MRGSGNNRSMIYNKLSTLKSRTVFKNAFTIKSESLCDYRPNGSAILQATQNSSWFAAVKWSHSYIHMSNFIDDILTTFIRSSYNTALELST